MWGALRPSSAPGRLIGATEGSRFEMRGNAPNRRVFRGIGPIQSRFHSNGVTDRRFDPQFPPQQLAHPLFPWGLTSGSPAASSLFQQLVAARLASLRTESGARQGCICRAERFRSGHPVPRPPCIWAAFPIPGQMGPLEHLVRWRQFRFVHLADCVKPLSDPHDPVDPGRGLHRARHCGAVGDLRPLRGTGSLVWVHVGGSGIEDLAPLDGLDGLTVAGRDDLEPPSPANGRAQRLGSPQDAGR